MYTIMITVSFSSVVQSLFIVWLWFRMNQDMPLMIGPPVYAEPCPSAPVYKGGPGAL